MSKCKHKEISISKGIFKGGSCIYPEEGYDIYIGLDSGMDQKTISFPWDEDKIGFLFKITDMTAPKSPNAFKQMIDWLEIQLDAGKRIHVGCIGGHGRTGTLLAALIAQINDEEDAIHWVRDNYCDKAVETSSQVNFLNKHYGVKKTNASKSSAWDHTSGGAGFYPSKKPEDRIYYAVQAPESLFYGLTN